MTVGGLSVGLDTAAAPKRGKRASPWTYALFAVAALAVISLVRVTTGATDLTSAGTVQAALTAAVPLAMAALAGLWAERAGVVNIGLEGMMVLGTFGAGYAGYQWGPWAGVVFGLFLGVVGGLLHAVATVTFGVDHIISGVAINLLAPGAALFMSKLYFTDAPGGGARQSPPIGDAPKVTVPGFADLMGTIEDKHWFLLSDLAGVLRGLTTQISVLTLLAAALIIGTGWLLWRSAFGLRLRSCGEAPAAAESLGVNVYKYKYLAVTASGAFAGLGGAFFAVSSGQFREGQTGGRGFIGLAAMIFGNWRPGGLATGAGLFGYTDAMSLRGSDAVHALLLLLGIALLVVAVTQYRSGHHVLSGFAAAIGVLFGWWFFASDEVPPELVGAAPYVVTLLVLTLAAQRLRPPKLAGEPYRRGQSG
ncbi:ABC transporter permease [Actinokineospora auranticolor]|uniref:Simple sugar transport system permease protein n=1 Tax=Actinokineospora auranticolor TaxID=155976 RepID=A0A2S6GWZ4_9PSEU|nr:ABC transporter permease [Actinokineospora auranticolor]PPK69706.1 simple sugar transport system permease protein [Actinokineospora auranticolor]